MSGHTGAAWWKLRGEDTAIVDLGGIRKEISLALVDGVRVGDYVILHVGYALSTARPRGGRAHAGAVCRAAAVGERASEAQGA